MEKTTQRRTQADRRAAGRNALIEGTIACLGELGYAAATSQEIVKRADCTTGAIQHHFGSKNGMFIAVLNQAADEFKTGFADSPAPAGDLEARCDWAIAALYGLYTTPRYRAVQSLILGAQHDAELRDLVARQRRGALAVIRQAWLAAFADTGCPADTLLGLLEIVVAVLRDVHFHHTVDADEARAKLDHNTALVKRMVLTELQRPR